MIYAGTFTCLINTGAIIVTCAIFNIHRCLLTLCLPDAGVTVSLEEKIIYWILEKKREILYE